jgi:hypothetical protein
LTLFYYPLTGGLSEGNGAHNKETDMTYLISPTLNINGSSAEDLIAPRREALDHLMDAIEALRKVAPNGRDYPYPDGFDALTRDRDIHFTRLESLKSLREEIFAEALAIQSREA